MNDEKIIPNGTEVYVFNKYGHKTKPIMKGIVVSSKDSGNLSQHGSPWSVQVYDVQGENGIEYFGAYGNDLYNYYFRTKENYINYLNWLISCNNNQIKELKKENNELRELMKTNWFEESDRVQDDKTKVYIKRI